MNIIVFGALDDTSTGLGWISKIDKNFRVETKIERDGLKFYDAESEPFRVHGVFREGEYFRRLPESVAKSVSEGVHYLHTNTAGGRVRFKTNSSFVAINVDMVSDGIPPHMAFSGYAGFDMYEKNSGFSDEIATNIIIKINFMLSHPKMIIA